MREPKGEFRASKSGWMVSLRHKEQKRDTGAVKMDTLTNQKRRSLDEFLDESGQYESRFEEIASKESSGSNQTDLVTEIKGWLQECAEQGRYIALGSAERRAYRSLLERWNSRLRDHGYYLDRISSLADFDSKAGHALTGECPYPGLEPYTKSRSGNFFGRERLISHCVTHLEQPGNQILLLIGASGSGKSSLALAGVLPRLTVLHQESWLFAPRMTPGANPLAELAGVVAQAVEQPDRATEIEYGLREKPTEANRRIAAWCHNKPLMLLVDQFEELLTMCRDSTKQREFAEILFALSQPTASLDSFSCRVLLTLRTDHLARFEGNAALKQLYIRLVGEENLHYLSAIGFEDIARAIKEPATAVGLRFIPPSLIKQLASQTAGLSNGLPLLQFALRHLWDTRPKNESGEPLDMITEEMVKSLPDVARALGTVADGVFRSFSDSQQRICERLLQELLVLDESFEEPLRRRRIETEITQVLETRFPIPNEVASVINAFVSAGLLRRFGESPNAQLEVAHEALLRHWDHIHRLVTGGEVKERLHLIKQIGRAAGDWVEHDRSNGYLSLRGERLDRAISYANDGWLAESESAAYVDACRQQNEDERLNEQRAKEEKERADAAEKRMQKSWAWAAIGLIIVAILAWHLLQGKSDELAKTSNELTKTSNELRAASGQLEVSKLLLNAWTNLSAYDVTKQVNYARKVAEDAREVTKNNPDLGAGWYLLGHAEYRLQNKRNAVDAFRKVPETYEYFYKAMNVAAAIYFEDLGETDNAYSSSKRAIERAPDDLDVLSNYAELLLAQGENKKAKDKAAQAQKHKDAQLPGQAHVRAAMSFVEFVAELLSDKQAEALITLDEIASQVKTSAHETAEAEASGEKPAMWEYKGIRRSLEKRSEITPKEQLLKVLNFMETNGKEGTLDDMRQWLRSRLRKG